MVKFLKHWLPAIAFAAFIFGFSGMSSPPGASLAPDYLAHSIEYGIFGLTLLWGLTAGGCRSCTVSRAFFAWGIAFAFALTDELHQSFVPRRDPSFTDLFADALGAALFITVTVLIVRWRCASAARFSE